MYFSCTIFNKIILIILSTVFNRTDSDEYYRKYNKSITL